ncbi:MFS transporter [Modestobacter sp. VKM Ac-2978]|nr:MFS transporter [Modestobacter sp. VKM Ac-2978]MCZ2849843.1 MFS transporter [Modestobacter sp. VKM Ac-2978]
MTETRTSDQYVGGPAATSDRRWWLLTALALAQLMIALDTTVITIALPSAQADLGFADSARQWVVTGYALAFGSLLLLSGRLSDRWGRRRLLVIGLAGFALTSALGRIAPNIEVLVGARIGQGSSRRCSPRPHWPWCRPPSPTPQTGCAPSASSGRSRWSGPHSGCCSAGS